MWGLERVRVLKLDQGGLNPLITFILRTEDGEGDGLGSGRNPSRWAMVVKALMFMMVFILPSCPNLSPASDSFHVGNTPPVQTHFILEETFG